MSSFPLKVGFTMFSPTSIIQFSFVKVAELKACESELKSLKQTSQEQKRALRSLTRQVEELQLREKILQEETTRLKNDLDREKSHFSAIKVCLDVYNTQLY